MVSLSVRSIYVWQGETDSNASGVRLKCAYYSPTVDSDVDTYSTFEVKGRYLLNTVVLIDRPWVIYEHPVLLVIMLALLS